MRVLCRRTTPDDFGRNRWADISIPVLRVEDDSLAMLPGLVTVQFQSTSSVWRTTEGDAMPNFFLMISIHVLRVEDDAIGKASLDSYGFQSTSSVWRTTRRNRHAGHGEPISIHVLRVEDDSICFQMGSTHGYFNPRPPCGGRHGVKHYTTDIVVISIHVLRVEDDSAPPRVVPESPYFNPRPPCGGRRRNPARCIPSRIFQSTSSVWRTTFPVCKSALDGDISIHVLRVEDDNGGDTNLTGNCNFNPRPPCGGRL